MQARASVAISSNETIIAAEAWAQLAAPVAAQTEAVRLASIKSPSALVRLPLVRRLLALTSNRLKREKLRCTPYNASLQEPTKSTKTVTRVRLL